MFSGQVENDGPANKAEGVAREERRKPREDSVSTGERALQEQEDLSPSPEKGRPASPSSTTVLPFSSFIHSFIHATGAPTRPNTNILGSR